MKTNLKPTTLSTMATARTTFRRLAAVIALGLLASSFSAWGAPGAAKYWTGAASANWSNASNWTNSLGVAGAPVDADDVIFPAGSPLSPNNDLVNLKLKSVTFIGGGYTVSGGALSLSGGLTNISGGLNAFGCKVTLTAAQTFSLNANTIISGDITNGGFLLTVISSGTGAASGEFQGIVVGAGGITKLGVGTLKINGTINNTYTGKTKVSEGTLFILQQESLGGFPASTTSDQLTLDGGTLEIALTTIIGNDVNNKKRGVTIGAGGGTFLVDATKSFTVGSIITGAGNLSKTGLGTADFKGVNTYTGKTIVSDGTLMISLESRLGTATGGLVPDQLTISNGATLNVYGSFTLSAPKRGVTLGIGGGIISVDSGFTFEVAKAITGVGNLTKDGDGALKLSTVDNTYTGKTIIASGSLQIDSETRLGANPASFTADQLTINASATFEAFGSFTIDDSNRGVTLAADSPIIQVDPGFTLEVKNPITGAGALDFYGGGTLKLSTANSYEGGTMVLFGGTLAVDAADRLGAAPGAFNPNQIVLDTTSGGGATLKALGSFTLDANYGINLANIGAVISVDAPFAVQIDGVINDDQVDQDNGNLFSAGYGLTKAGLGTLNLMAANTFTGPTTVNTGKLLVNGSTDAGSAATILAGATLGGSGTVSGTVDNSGILSPGNSPGTLNTGAVTWESGGSYQFEINNATGTEGADPGWDLLNISGSLTVAATSGSPFTIQVTSLAGSSAGSAANFDKTQAYSWRIATASGGVSGFAASKFAIDDSLFQNAKGGGLFSVTQSGNNVYLNFTPFTAGPLTVGRAWGTYMRIPVASVLANVLNGTAPYTLTAVTSPQVLDYLTFDSNYIYFAPGGNTNTTLTYSVADSASPTPNTASGMIIVNVTNAVSSANSIRSTGGSVTINFAGVAGFKYVVERSSDLANWTTVETITAPASGVWTFTDPSPPNPSFYRTRQNN